MSINHLPNEILVQILDDYSLELEDLALLSRVSRHWHGAILPALYKSYTLRFHPWLEPDDERKLESFMKYGNYVKYVRVFGDKLDSKISKVGLVIASLAKFAV
ncbi:hypothetical protein DRE_01195 [Drechslerella stenobrocha 248]|uniref:F-box domain-containing protein n=1 Tax=Drechslerella stenobrocha 248 TaxID=1043628 RepID=W7HMM1_9PEZI|nr:hypothetical protein DRE_01195 [Drechslerella stenobrocha 248]